MSRWALLGAESAAAFSPASISGISLWLKADSIAQSDNTAVSSWADSSGNGYTATQGTSGNQPTLQTNEINGLPVVRFDGSNDYLVSDAPAGGAEQHLFAVIRVTTVANEGETIRSGSAAGALHWRIQYGRNAALNQSTAEIGYGDPDITINTAWLVSFSFSDSGNAWVSRNNGAADANGTYSSSLTARTSVIGSRDGSAEFFHGDIAELITYSAVLSSTDRDAVESYLKTRYGIA